MAGFALKLSTLVVGASAALPTQYLTLTCDGAFEMLPGHPMGMAMDLSFVYKAFTDEVSSSINDFAKICPNLPKDDLDRALGYLYLENYILQFSPEGRSEFAVSEVAMKSMCDRSKVSFPTFPLPAITNMPTSCNYNDYIQGKPCSVQVPLAGADVGIVLQAEQCPNSKFPALTLGCTGAGCGDLFRPCATDADCTTGAKKCVGLPLALKDYWPSMNLYLNQSMMYNAETDTSCDNPTPYSITVINNFIKNMMAKIGYDGAAPVLTAAMNVSFCDVSSTMEEIAGKLVADANSVDCYAWTNNETCSDFDECTWLSYDGISSGYCVDTCPYQRDEKTCLSAVRPDYCEWVLPDVPPSAWMCRTKTQQLPSILDDLPCTYSETGIDCSGLKAVDPLTQTKSEFGDWIWVDGGVNLLRWDCEGYVQVLDNKNSAARMRFKSGGLPSMIEVVTQAMSESMKCRVGMAADAVATFIDYFSPWSISFWVKSLFAPDATVLGGRTLQQLLLTNLDLKKLTLNNAPESCNLATLMAGKCDIGVDITDLLKGKSASLSAPWTGKTGLRLQVETCPTSGMVQGMISCEGVENSLCDVFKKPVGESTCNPADQSACGAGYQCVDMNSRGFPWFIRRDDGMGFVDETTGANIFRKLTGNAPSSSIAAVCLPNLDFTWMMDNDHLSTWMAKAFTFDNTTNTVTFVAGGTVTKPANAGKPLPDNKPGSGGGTGGGTGGDGKDVSAAPRTAALMASLLLPFAAFLLA